MRESMSPTVALVGRVSEVTSTPPRSLVHIHKRATSGGYPIGQVIVTTDPAARYWTVMSSTRPLMTSSPRRSCPLRSTLSTRSSSVVRSKASPPSASGAGRPTESATSTEKRSGSSMSLNSTGEEGAWARLKRTAKEHASLTASLISSSAPSATPARLATEAAMKRAVLTCSGKGVNETVTVGKARRSVCGGDGLVDRPVDRENLGEPGDPEDLEDALLGADQAQRPVVGTVSLEAAHQDAEAGRVKELDVLHVDNDVVATC